jgi:hypothetical protein
MYTYVLIVFFIVLAGLLMHYKPQQDVEGFAVRSVDAVKMPECVSRSTAAQSLLARLPSGSGSSGSSGTSAELRQLVTKVCCMEADIFAPSAGVYRTMHAQFRTSEDMEPPATIVGRCLRNAVNKRDIELIVEKYVTRGKELIRELCPASDQAEALAEWEEVVGRLHNAMTSVCLKEQPVMDRPLGARDMGFWEPENVADLSQYQGVSAVPK